MADALDELDSLFADSPTRPADWRFRRAKLLLAHKRPLSRLYDDQHIERAVGYLKERQSFVDPWERSERRRRSLYRSLYEAQDLYDAANESTRPRRRALEAALMASNATLAQVADFVNVPLRVVVAYERVFFNVRDRMNQLGYLLHHICGEALHTNLNESSYDILWKLYALTGGIHLLEAMIWLLDRDVMPSQLQALRTMRRRIRDVVSRRSVNAAVTLRTRDALTKLSLAELGARYDEMDKALETDAGAGDRALEAVSKAMSLVKFTVATAQQAAAERFAHASAGVARGVELRADQKLLAALGAPVNLSEHARQAAYPANAAGDKSEPTV